MTARGNFYGDFGLVGWGGPGLRRRQWWRRLLRRIGTRIGGWIPRRAQRFSPRAADRALAAVLKGGLR